MHVSTELVTCPGCTLHLAPGEPVIGPLHDPVRGGRRRMDGKMVGSLNHLCRIYSESIIISTIINF